MPTWDGMRVGNRPSMSFTFLYSVRKQSKGDLVFMRFECKMNQKRESVGGFSLLKIAMEWAIL